MYYNTKTLKLTYKQLAKFKVSTVALLKIKSPRMLHHADWSAFTHIFELVNAFIYGVQQIL
jgi:hypothetical protein